MPRALPGAEMVITVAKVRDEAILMVSANQVSM
jgi:hypothetical protein